MRNKNKVNFNFTPSVFLVDLCAHLNFRTSVQFYYYPIAAISRMPSLSLPFSYSLMIRSLTSSWLNIISATFSLFARASFASWRNSLLLLRSSAASRDWARIGSSLLGAWHLGLGACSAPASRVKRTPNSKPERRRWRCLLTKRQLKKTKKNKATFRFVSNLLS